MRLRRRAGFTLIEILMSVTIVALLSSIAVPKFREVRRRAMATQILGDFDVLRHAALSFYVDSQYFPREAASGQVPTNLTKYLPAGFTMKKPQWELDYEIWTAHASMFKAGSVVAISFTTPADSNLGRTAIRLFGNVPSFMVGSTYTLLISAF